MIPPPNRRNGLPSTKALELIKLVERWNVSATELLDGLNLTQIALLEDPDLRISCATMGILVERAFAMTGEPGLGFYIGLQRRISNISGPIGLAAMRAKTLGEALELVMRTAHMASTAMDYETKVEGEVAFLTLNANPELGKARDYACFSHMLGLWHIARILTGRELEESFEFALPAPSYFSRFSHLLPNARFDQPATRIVFKASHLDLPVFTPNSDTLKLVREQCEREFLALGFGSAIVDRVRNVLPKPRGFCSLEEVATALRVSSRTLKRQLAAKRVRFSKLLEQGRCEKALLLLRSPQCTLEDVTERVGYSTVPNFIRAFRRWTGKTPAAYRRAVKSGSYESGGSGFPSSISGLDI